MSEPKSQPLWMQVVGLLVFVFVLLFAWAFAALWQFAVPAYIPFYAYVLYALCCALLCVPFARAGSFRRTKIQLLSFCLFAIAMLWLIPLGSRQPFLSDLSSVQPGMTRAQVKAIMGQYMQGTGWPANPFSSSDGSTDSLTEIGSDSIYQTKNNAQGEMEIVDSLVYRHSDDGAYNADWGVIRFKNGRVVSVEFMPD